MAQLQKSVVTLRIKGDALVPEEITKLLGAAPFAAQTKGQELVNSRTGRSRVAGFGMWRLRASDREPEDLDGQIQEILGQLTDDLAVWRTITARYAVDLFCGLFMDECNEGLTISPKSLAALGRRGIELGLDIYAGVDADESA